MQQQICLDIAYVDAHDAHTAGQSTEAEQIIQLPMPGLIHAVSGIFLAAAQLGLGAVVPSPS
jgi:hypothetical protein